MIKVLVIEDEIGIANSIAQCFSWFEMGCELLGVAANGIMALEMCLLDMPDLIISDIVMPGLDGLAFLKYIKDKKAEIKVIILTGHRNFDYAKDALNLGAAAFMLKPIDFAELKANVQRMIDSIMENNEHKKISNQNEFVLTKHIEGHIYREEDILQQTKSILERMTSYRLAVMKFDDERSNTHARTKNLFLLCENIMQGRGDIALLQPDENRVVMIMMCKKDLSEDLRNYFQQCQSRVLEIFESSVSIGISRVKKTHSDLHEAYLEAQKAFGKRFFSGRHSINFFTLEEDIGRGFTMSYPDIVNHLCPQLVDLIQHKEENELRQSAAAILSSLVKESGKQPEVMKSSFIILITLCVQLIVKEDARQMSFLFEKYANFMGAVKCGTAGELRDFFIDLIMDLNNYHKIKGGNKKMVIDKVLEYIQNNYQKMIQLEDLAQCVYLSPSYLSALIVQETGKNFIEILNGVRIQTAAKLLEKLEHRIADVAFQCGFNDPPYFSVTFKKYMGCTPSDYRSKVVLKA